MKPKRIHRLKRQQDLVDPHDRVVTEGRRRSANAGSTTTTTSARPRFRLRSSPPTSTRPARPGLPLVVHTREADEEMARMLAEAHAEGAVQAPPGTATPLAPSWRGRAAALGGVVQRLRASPPSRPRTEVRAVIADMPADRIILETDCPYLAPIPMRGRRNEPAFLPHVAAKLAEIRGWSYRRHTRPAHGRRLLRTVRPDSADRERGAGIHHPGLRLLRRRAAGGRQLGRVRSHRTEEPPHPLRPSRAPAPHRPQRERDHRSHRHRA